MLNANADGKILEEIAVPDSGAKDLLTLAMENRKFSARAYYQDTVGPDGCGPGNYPNRGR